MIQTQSYNHNIGAQPVIGGQVRKKIENYSFFLTDKIGKGYTSTVYKGRNDLTNQTVAVKVIQLKSLNDHIKKKLLQTELECFKTINHVNLLKYIDSYQTANNCYIITQYCDGGDLEKILRTKGKLNQTQFVNFFKQFLSGYQSFNNAGFIHRDIKPANIFMKGDKIKLADFGMVKRLVENPRDTYNVGTPVYMPPESLISNIYSEKTDIWSIGVMCYQLTHGKFPWRGQDQRELKFNIQNIRPMIDLSLVSNQLASLINQCLDKNPHSRLNLQDLLSHPWVRNNLVVHDQMRATNMNINMKSNSVKQIFLGGYTNSANEKSPNMISPARSYTMPKPISINHASSTNLVQLQSVPSIQIIESQNINTLNKGSKSQRPTMDSSHAPQNSNRKRSILQENRQKNQQRISEKKSERGIQKVGQKNTDRKSGGVIKKSPLDYLISILNYMRYMYKLYKKISETKSKGLKQVVRNKLTKVVLKQLVKCLEQQEKTVKNKQNVYFLDGWEQFVKSKKWSTYVNVVDQYSEKYRKAYERAMGENEEYSINRRLCFPLKMLIQQVYKLTKNNINKKASSAYSYQRHQKQSEKNEQFEGIQILDHLTTLYSMQQAIFCYGWIIFVDKSQINEIVENKSIINEGNWMQIWHKLENRVQNILGYNI